METPEYNNLSGPCGFHFACTFRKSNHTGGDETERSIEASFDNILRCSNVCWIVLIQDLETERNIAMADLVPKINMPWNLWTISDIGDRAALQKMRQNVAQSAEHNMQKNQT